MKQAGLIGYPLGHSISPAMHNAAYEAMGMDARYEAWSTPPDEVEAAVKRLRGGDVLGMQVTVPHKQAVVPFLDSLDVTAKAIGAVNTILVEAGRLVGYNTDKYGYIRSLREAGCDPRGMRVLVLGVGGAERAVAYGLAEAGASSIALAGRNAERLRAAAEHFESTTPGGVPVTQVLWQDDAVVNACAGADLIVNCTPVGMRHTESEGNSPVPASALRPGLWVSDIVYNPLETELLRLARAAGANTVGGLDMLVYQAVEAIRLWTGREAPVDIMKKAALAALPVKE
jgi:shikimate dehydrogenase